ncbi:alpha/beta hydrolase [Mucilaginibacter sp. 21P]|uniref:alpha/beta hydrolase n=1 Tax=Mucilaginibacter sp. 21P TaxID=2778902 RepID=UPI001C562A1B|nr:alpha/beta hydrolase [Mucilaginibacter sp. 21P]QXV66878.1 alpha/beta hydrolase [Mucilaginibacter sp. 21P]
MNFSESTVQLQHQGVKFSITVLEATKPKSLVVFAAGRGGSPARHLPLLGAIADQGCTVIAPHFDLIPGHTPTKEQLDSRIRKLEIVLTKYLTPAAIPIIGIGHSIGATLLLALAGVKAMTFSGDLVETNFKSQFNGLVLLAPAVDFYLHPGALNTLNTGVYLRTGAKDTVTPPERTILFKNMLEEKHEVRFILDENAGHFSYMDQLPPNVEDIQPEREIFLSALASDVTEYIVTLN